MVIKKFLNGLYSNAVKDNLRNIHSLVEENNNAKFLDLGCDDGRWTLELSKKINTTNAYGLEIVSKRMNKAKKLGVLVSKADLNHKFPFEKNYFDVVHANQVIEHLTDIDSFVSEIYRVLKPSGYAIISTENGSSWCNIFAAFLGFQIFSLTNFSCKQSGLGNPFALHKTENLKLPSWTHKTILNYFGLKDLFKVYNFKIQKIKCAGYFPFPSFFGKIDKIHSHFITLKIIK